MKMWIIPSSIIVLLLLVRPILSQAWKPHVINFRSPSLYPEGLAYDHSAQHFLVGSLHHRAIYSVSDAGVVDTLVCDLSLPPNTTFLGLAVDKVNHRLLAAVHSAPPLPPFNALAAYDLRSRRRLFLSFLSNDADQSSRTVANAVAADFKGNAYVTNSAGNFIWRVSTEGEASIFSRSPIFTQYPAACDPPHRDSGLNGIAYFSKGYLLVVQTNTGKMFKVDADDGTARRVLLNKDLIGADGMAVRNDGVVLVVSSKKLWFLKSEDSWGEGVVFDETALDEEKFPTSVVVGREDRVYVLYGCVMEGIMENGKREWFGIEEVRSERESKGENVWVFVLLGLGLAYFLFWRFQMKQLVKNMEKKHN
uniref:Uncharacterized protein n=1 Tax=Rhizophora mucronata TaxID=61149 RepID=A0A2P2NR74_RHIMU